MHELRFQLFAAPLVLSVYEPAQACHASGGILLYAPSGCPAPIAFPVDGIRDSCRGIRCARW